MTIARPLRAAALAAALSAGFTPLPAQRAAPDHVLFMVFDQMRPDYIDRFGLDHFKRLRARARDYPDAYVGCLRAGLSGSDRGSDVNKRPR